MDGYAAAAASDPHRRDAEAGRAVAYALRRAARGARGGMPRVGCGARALRRGMTMRAWTAARGAQSGIALVLALWLTILLTVIASGFAFSMRSEALATRNTLSMARARALADGAVERTAFELMRPRVANAWTFDGQPHRWTDGDAAIVATAVDEAARIDLNTAPDALLKNLLIAVGGLEEPAAGALVDAIADWRDPDD